MLMPGPRDGVVTGRVLLFALAVLAAGWLMSGPESLHPLPPPGELCARLLEVGQGDSILLSFPGGERILVDGGGVPGGRWDVGLQRVVPALRRAGVHQLEAVVATHEMWTTSGGLPLYWKKCPRAV